MKGIINYSIGISLRPYIPHWDSVIESYFDKYKADIEAPTKMRMDGASAIIEIDEDKTE